MFECNCSDCGGPRWKGPCTNEMVKVVKCKCKGCKSKKKCLVYEKVSILKISYF